MITFQKSWSKVRAVEGELVEIDRQGRIRLTMKDLAPKQETEAESAT